jgi:arginine exporter protein ArgO
LIADKIVLVIVVTVPGTLIDSVIWVTTGSSSNGGLLLGWYGCGVWTISEMLTVVVRVVADTEEYDVTPVVRFRVNVDWLNWVVSSVTVDV